MPLVRPSFDGLEKPSISPSEIRSSKVANCLLCKLSSAIVLLDLLNLSKKDLIYFGDGEADIDLLEFANFGFTVKNSIAHKKLTNLNSIDEPEKNGFSNYLNSII